MAKSGVYVIRCESSGKIYIGSSKRIAVRWSQHRSKLRQNRSVCRGLQNAWNKYGESAFTFSVLEECSPERQVLERREQHYLDVLKPQLNMVQDATRHVSDEHIAKLVSSNRKRFAAITHCPRGHEYTPANTYFNKKSKRICRACNALRVSKVYEAETPEQRETRRQKVRAYYAANREKYREMNRAYAAAHKAEKREYDRAYRLRKRA